MVKAVKPSHLCCAYLCTHMYLHHRYPWNYSHCLHLILHQSWMSHQVMKTIKWWKHRMMKAIEWWKRKPSNDGSHRMMGAIKWWMMGAIKWWKPSDDEKHQLMRTISWWEPLGDENHQVMKTMKSWKPSSDKNHQLRRVIRWWELKVKEIFRIDIIQNTTI